MPVASGPFETLLLDLKSILIIHLDPPKLAMEYCFKLYPLEQRIRPQMQDLKEAPFFWALLHLKTEEGFVNIGDLDMWSKLEALYLKWDKQMSGADRDWAGGRLLLEDIVDFYENRSAFRSQEEHVIAYDQEDSVRLVDRESGTLS